MTPYTSNPPKMSNPSTDHKYAKRMDLIYVFSIRHLLPLLKEGEGEVAVSEGVRIWISPIDSSLSHRLCLSEINHPNVL